MWSVPISPTASQLCLPNDGSWPSQGHLSHNPQIEMMLQWLLYFAPACFMITCGLIRIVHLCDAKLVVVPNRRLYLKAPVSIAICMLQLLLVMRMKPHYSPFQEGTPNLLFLIADALLCIVSFFEHGRNIRPSTAVTMYLLLNILSSIVRAGLRFVSWNLCHISSLSLAIFVARIILFVIENQSKRPILQIKYNQLSPEETAGFLDRIFYWWVNKILKTGYSKNLSLADIPRLNKDVDATRICTTMQIEWQKKKASKSRYAVLFALFNSSWRLNIKVILPRMLFIILRCSQPILISRAIKFVSQDLSPFETRNEAFCLVLFTFIVYVGMALCSGFYQRILAQITILTDMALVGVIYNDSLLVKDGESDDAAAVALMSNDTEAASNCGDVLHEAWSQVFEFCIGMYMLANELGWVCILPPIIVIGITQIIEFITENLGQRQMLYSKATQMRIAMTKSVLDSIKNIKMMGLVDIMEKRVESAREVEIKHYVSFYQLLVAFFISSVALNLFSPALTLIFYAIQAHFRGTKSVDIEMIFTTLAIVDIVSTPANTLLGILPEAASVLAAFDRIQTYLMIPVLEDKREFLNNHQQTTKTASTMKTLDPIALEITEATICPAPNADAVLKDISTNWKKGDLVAISGTIGAGKTSLARALLGEAMIHSGTIHTAFKTAAYCSQVPWLTNGTIREAICGHSIKAPIDEEWYQRVLHVCELQQDLDQMPNRDETMIGSRGTTLSGGQKQRVALARAVFAREESVILDDVVSALDASTQRRIIDKLIGPSGLFKKLGTTVVLITQATHHISLADYIIILNDKGTIEEQGSWSNLRRGSGYTSKIKLEKESLEPQIEQQENHYDPTKSLLPLEKPEADKHTAGPLPVSKISDQSLYKYYFSAIKPLSLLFLIVSLTLYASLVALIPYWLRLMAESGGQQLWFYTIVYFFLSLGAFLSVATAVATIFLVITPQSSKTLHSRLLHTVINAPQSYFAETDIGTILNYFTSDMMMIDRSLPFALFQVFQAIFLLLSQCILLGTIQPLVLLTLPFTILIVYWIQNFYLATSRQLRLIDLEARSLINSSFLETIEGAATIRAFGWQQAFINHNLQKIALSLRPDYLLTCVQRWLDIVLDLIVPALAIIVIGISIALKGTTTGGQIGIALNVALQANTYILRLVNAWTYVGIWLNMVILDPITITINNHG